MLSQKGLDVAGPAVSSGGLSTDVWILGILGKEEGVEGQGPLEQGATDLFHLWDVLQFLVTYFGEHLVHGVHRPLEIGLGLLTVSLGFVLGLPLASVASWAACSFCWAIWRWSFSPW